MGAYDHTSDFRDGATAQGEHWPSQQKRSGVICGDLQGLPLGIAILQFEDPRDVKTFRILDLNPAAARITGHRRKPTRQDAG